MAATIRNDNGALWAEQPANAALDYALDWTDGAEQPVAVTDATWEAEPALDFSGQAVYANRTLARIAGGTPGRWHMVRCTAQTSAGVMIRTFRLRVLPASLIDLPDGPSAWGIPFDAVSDFRRTVLMQAARQYLPDAELTDAALWAKMRAAEATLEKELGVWLTPREVRPLATPPQALADLEASGEQVATEAGYDYEPRLFRGEAWGLVQLRRRHVSKVHGIAFTWPSPASPIYRIPTGWVRLEPRPGRFNLIPGQDVSLLPLNAYILSALGGGRSIPLMLQIEYRAGIENIAHDHPDVLDLLGKMATLSVLDGSMMPPSASVSADGLSQSYSWDAQKHREMIEQKIDSLRDALVGPRMIVA